MFLLSAFSGHSKRRGLRELIMSRFICIVTHFGHFGLYHWLLCYPAAIKQRKGRWKTRPKGSKGRAWVEWPSLGSRGWTSARTHCCPILSDSWNRLCWWAWAIMLARRGSLKCEAVSLEPSYGWPLSVGCHLRAKTLAIWSDGSPAPLLTISGRSSSDSHLELFIS